MPRAKRAETGPKLQAVVASWLADREMVGRSARTLALYRDTMSGFVAHAGDVPLSDVTADTIRLYLTSLRPTHKASSIGTRFRVLRAFFRWCEREDRIDRVPTRTVQPPALPQRERPGLSDDELVRLVSVCNPRTKLGARDRALLLVLAGTALRISEAASLRRDDIVRGSVTASQIRVIGKGNKERTVALEPVVRRALAEWLEYRQDDDPALWTGQQGALTAAGLRQIIAARAKQAGVAGVHPHRFRNTALANMARAGMDPLAVMKIAGHAHVNQTEHYIRYAESARANEKLLDAAPLSRIDWGRGRKRGKR